MFKYNIIRRRKYIQRNIRQISLQTKRQSAVQYPEKEKNLFQTDKVLKDSLHMFDTQKKQSMNNVIA